MTLLELAERCERAKVGSYELNADITRVVRGFSDDWPVGYPNALISNYTASLDAAMTLVPEGCKVDVHAPLRDGENFLANCWWKPDQTALKSSRARALGEAQTEALARCAAALKARAQEADRHGS